MKKSFKFMVLPLIAMAATGCGGGNKNDSRRVVTFEFVDAGFGIEPYKALKEAFEEKNPEIRIDLVPNRSVDSTTSIAIDNGTCSDIIIYNRDVNDIRKWALQGLVYDLTDVFDQEIDDKGHTMKNMLDDNALKIAKYQDKFYNIPEYVSVQGFVYNASMFEHFGWTEPKTTKELEDLCKKIQVAKMPNGKSISPIIYCNEADGYLYFADQGWNTVYDGVANLDTFYKFESAEVYAPANSQGKLKGLELTQDFFFNSSKGYFYDKSSQTLAAEAQTKLITGEAAMMLNGSWFENEMSSSIKNTKMKMFPIPEIADSSNNILHNAGYTCPEGKKSVLNADCTTNMFIPAKAKHIEDAITFLKFITRPEMCELYTSKSNAVRPLKYNCDPTNPAYNNMSDFGKSILKIANENFLYVPASDAPISILGYAKYRPTGYHFWHFADITPAQAVLNDYNYCKGKWDAWMEEVNRSFN